MKAFLVSLSFALSISAAVAGPSVSGGVALEQEFERCVNKTQQTVVSVKAEVTLDNVFAFVSIGKSNSTLKCKDGNAIRRIDGQETIWSCVEQRAGGGQLVTQILRNSQGLKYGVVYRYDILNRLQELYKLTCDQQVSN